MGYDYPSDWCYHYGTRRWFRSGIATENCTDTGYGNSNPAAEGRRTGAGRRSEGSTFEGRYPNQVGRQRKESGMEILRAGDERNSGSCGIGTEGYCSRKMCAGTQRYQRKNRVQFRGSGNGSATAFGKNSGRNVPESKSPQRCPYLGCTQLRRV